MNDIDQLYEFYKPEFEIYEGLITSSPLHRVISILLKTNYTANPNYKQNTFTLRYIFNEEYDIAEKELDKLLQLTNNLGWFPSFISSYNHNGELKKSKWAEKSEVFYKIYNSFILEGFINILFSFEAKYDILQERHPRFLYHTCNSAVCDKILKYGLSPKSRSKKSFHPERVFLSKTINDAYEFAHEIFIKNGIKEQTILKIDTVTIEYYLRLYRDPNYIGKAVYTLNHITPYCISIADTIIF